MWPCHEKRKRLSCELFFVQLTTKCVVWVYIFTSKFFHRIEWYEKSHVSFLANQPRLKLSQLSEMVKNSKAFLRYNFNKKYIHWRNWKIHWKVFSFQNQWEPFILQRKHTAVPPSASCCQNSCTGTVRRNGKFSRGGFKTELCELSKFESYSKFYGVWWGGGIERIFWSCCVRWQKFISLMYLFT